MKQSLEDEVAADSKAMKAEKEAKAAAEEKKAAAEGELAETMKVLEDGKGALESLQAGCLQTASDHETTVASRAEELKVLAKAKETLASSTAGAVEQAYSMLQTSSMIRMEARLQVSSQLSH